MLLVLGVSVVSVARRGCRVSGVRQDRRVRVVSLVRTAATVRTALLARPALPVLVVRTVKTRLFLVLLVLLVRLVPIQRFPARRDRLVPLALPVPLAIRARLASLALTAVPCRLCSA